jgi:integrase
MPKIVIPLNDKRVRALKPLGDPPKERNYSDGQGLALRVKANGTKMWLFNYSKPFTTQRVNISFGVYPDVSLAEARERRDKARALVSNNTDPKEYREAFILKKATEASQTLKQVARKWLEVKKSTVSTDHATDIWRSLELHIFPYLAQVSIHEITAPKAIEALTPLATKGSLETVRRVAQRLNEVMYFAVNSGVIHANPTSGISKAFKTPNKQHLPTIKPNELPQFLKDFKTARIKATTRAMMEWQLHTMVRPFEAAGTRWDEIDLDALLWTIPAERMKKKREHIVPISKQALAILEHIRPISGHREHVFPSDKNPKAHTSEQTPNMVLKRMGYGGRLVAHGFRSLASTTLNEQGFNADVIEAALAHVDGNEVRKAYNRAEYIDQRRVIMTWWSDRLETQETENEVN